jgi:hypothetical protein
MEHSKNKINQYSSIITVLMLFWVPIINIISSSPANFKDIFKIFGVLFYLSIAVYYILYIINTSVKNYFKLLIPILVFSFSIYLCINYFIFTDNYGLMDFFIIHDASVLYSTMRGKLLDLIIIILTLFISTISIKKFNHSYIEKILLTVLVFIIFYSINPLYKIINYQIVPLKTPAVASEDNRNLGKKFYFSKNGKNILIIFFDRFVGGLVPDILKDLPSLKEEFSGFTWYPNTLSFGIGTVIGLPAIYGGYKYADVDSILKSQFTWDNAWTSPNNTEMQKKFQPATNFMLEKFADVGFHSFIADPTFIDSKKMEKLSNGRYKYDYLVKNIKYGNKFYNRIYTTIMKQKFKPEELVYYYLLPFSIFKTFSPSIRKRIYREGKWNSQGYDNLIGSYISELSYAKAWPHISKASQAIKGSYNFITSNLTHDVYAARDNGKFSISVSDLGDELQQKLKRESKIKKEDIKRFKDGFTTVHFYADKEALVRVAEWLKWFKKEGIYNNTKIILVSDHGISLHNPMFKNQKSQKGISYSNYHALLMVKEFHATGKMITSHEFMTTADVPGIALSAIDPDAKQKYSYDKSKGFRLYINYKDKGVLKVYHNIFDPSNWVYKE